MMITCPICSRSVCVHWPEHWVYKRGQTYFCSDQCMDVDSNRTLRTLNKVLRKKKEQKTMKNQKITLEQKRKAVEMAIAGENPLAYLKQCGSKNPSATWQYIRQTLEKKDPEKYAELPDKLPKAGKSAAEAMDDAAAAADKFFDQCAGMGLLKDKPATVKIDGPIRIETPEGNQVEVIETPEQPKPPRLKFKIKSVETELGTYTAGNKYFEFRSAKDNSDAIEMLLEDFIALSNELPAVMEVLGVKQ